MADSRGSFPTIEGPGACIKDPIELDLSDDEGDTEQAPPLTHEGNNAGRVPLRRRQPRPAGLILHTYPENLLVPHKGMIAGRYRSRLVYKLNPKIPTAPRTGKLPELPLAPPLRPLSRPSLLQQLLCPGLAVSVPFAFLTRPLQCRPIFACVQPTNYHVRRLADAVRRAFFNALTPEPAIAPAPGPIVVEETRRLTYVAWGLPDEFTGPSVLVQNESVKITITRLE
ncbi:hypothetical protein FRC07_009021 [Ceratobasidium sp. 392]|nr:hypothetical protein FRC07_009021 [Ceratobasidium sp. 392]